MSPLCEGRIQTSASPPQQMAFSGSSKLQAQNLKMFRKPTAKAFGIAAAPLESRGLAALPPGASEQITVAQ
jgi:hypothetical protein